MLGFLIFLGMFGLFLIINKVIDTKCKCSHEFEAVTSVCSSTKAAYICKKCGKVKYVKLK